MTGQTNANLFGYTEIEEGKNITIESYPEDNKVKISAGLSNDDVTTDKIANKAVTGAKIADGTIGRVKLSSSLQEQIDDAANPELEAGANITITESGNTLTISSEIEAGSITSDMLSKEVKDELDSKQQALVAGDNVTIEDNLDGTQTIDAKAYQTMRKPYSLDSETQHVAPRDIATGVYDVVTDFMLWMNEVEYYVPEGSVMVVTNTSSMCYGVVVGNNCIDDMGHLGQEAIQVSTRADAGFTFVNTSADNFQNYRINFVTELISTTQWTNEILVDLLASIMGNIESYVEPLLEKKQDKPLSRTNVLVTKLGRQVICNFADHSPAYNVSPALAEGTVGYGVFLNIPITLNTVRIECDLKVNSSGTGHFVLMGWNDSSSSVKYNFRTINMGQDHHISFQFDAATVYRPLNCSEFGIMYVPDDSSFPAPNFTISNIVLYDANGVQGDYSNTVELGSNDGLGPSTFRLTYNPATIIDPTPGMDIKDAWVQDVTYPEFTYRADIELDGVTADMLSQVGLNYNQMISGDYAPFSETADGVVRIYSNDNSSIFLPYVMAEEIL